MAWQLTSVQLGAFHASYGAVRPHDLWDFFALFGRDDVVYYFVLLVTKYGLHEKAVGSFLLAWLSSNAP